MLNFIQSHESWGVIVAAYWIYSAAISNLPAPDATSGKGYTFFYGFLHTLAGNLTTAFQAKLAASNTNKEQQL